MKNAGSTPSSNKSLPVSDAGEIFVWVRRNWNDHRIGKVRLSDLSGFHWSQFAGGQISGFGRVAPRPFLHAYMLCTQIVEGEISHTCRHGPPPHRIKVCMTKKDNRRAFPFLETLADSEHSRHAVFRKHRNRFVEP